MELQEIGRIHSIYKETSDAPRQGKLSSQESILEVYPAYIKGLDKIQALSHIIVLYWGSKANRSILEAKPPWAKDTYGVFATRAPHRPNPIAFCVCEIKKIEDNRLTVIGLDALDGSPLLDIKAYSSKIDSYPQATSHPFMKEI